MNVTEFPFPPISSMVMITITSIMGIIALSASVEGYFKASMNILERLILAAGALMLIVPETYSDVAGLIVVGGSIAFNIMKDKRDNPPSRPQAVLIEK